MKRVLVITNNLKQASFRVRIEKLVPLLAARGVELVVEIRPRGWAMGRLARRRLFKSAGAYDAVILQRKLLDAGEVRLLARSARRLIFDVDDAVMYCQGDAGFWERRRARKRFEAMARAVGHVVAGNEYLAELFRLEGAEVSVLPSVVDVKRYRVKRHEGDGGAAGMMGADEGAGARGSGSSGGAVSLVGETGSVGVVGAVGSASSAKGITLVWIGSRSTLLYVEEFLPALEEAANKVAGLKLLIVADETLHASGKLAIEHIPWSEAAEAEALLRGDIGIAPTPRNVWTEGKCGFKIVQYMAAGLPVIASPVGANAELVTADETGLLPATAADWAGAIVRLAEDAGSRQRMGAAGRRRAEAEYSLERAADFWVKLIG